MLSYTQALERGAKAVGDMADIDLSMDESNCRGQAARIIASAILQALYDDAKERLQQQGTTK